MAIRKTTKGKNANYRPTKKGAGMTAKGVKASVSISENVIPVVKDWDSFYGYILETKQPYLLERRPSVSSFRELLESGVEVPGLQPFTKRTLNIRSAT